MVVQRSSISGYRLLGYVDSEEGLHITGAGSAFLPSSYGLQGASGWPLRDTECWGTPGLIRQLFLRS